MLGRLAYYLRLAVLDFTRLWHTTQHHVVIIAGIVLPILLLLGLKRGHVAELRKELLESPTGRQITVFSGEHGDLITTQRVAELTGSISGIELVIPDLQKLVAVRAAGPGKGEGEGLDVTLFSTVAGDPILRQVGCEIPEDDDRAIVVSDLVATRLGVGVGDTVDVIARRTTSRGEETAKASMKITSIITQESDKSNIGYASFAFLDKCDQWTRGFWVQSLGWPASGDPIPPRYSVYLLFTEAAGALTDDDIRALKDRGFAAQVTNDVTEITLAGAIPLEKAKQLTVWRVVPDGSTATSPVWVTNPPGEFEAVTQADDAVVAWNPPRVTGEPPWPLAGISMKKRSWLRTLLSSRRLAFEPTDATAVFVASSPTAMSELRIPTRDNVVINLSPKPVESADEAATDGDQSEETASGVSPLLVTPAHFLARLGSYERGEAEYDSTSKVFVEKPAPSAYGKARVFTRNIDEVPAVVDALTQRDFSVMSESGRIAEIHEQDGSLQLLVWVVATGVFLFGIITVFSVLLDSTDRKRGVLGILRVMGVSRRGIFLLVLARAAALGILAGLLAVVAGFGIERALAWTPPPGMAFAEWKPTVSIQIGPLDVAIVIAGAILCAAIGAILPALRASRIDPFDAIVEGRFT